MRRVEELCRTAENRGIARSTGFLSDREQALAAAAMNRAQCGCGRFWGGWPGAERRVLCLEPPGAWAPEPVAALRIAAKGEPLPGHRDLLGAMLGLGIERVCVGDILPDAQDPGRLLRLCAGRKGRFPRRRTHAGRARRRVRSALRRRAGACACRAAARAAGSDGAQPARRRRAGRHDEHLPARWPPRPSPPERSKSTTCRCARRTSLSMKATFSPCAGRAAGGCRPSAAKAARTVYLSHFFSIDRPNPGHWP